MFGTKSKCICRLFCFVLCFLVRRISYLEKKTAIKAAKYEIQKSWTCRATLFRCKFSSMFLVFHLARSTWCATKTFVAGWINAERWLVDFVAHEQICCATSCEFDEKRATKPKFVAQSRPDLGLGFRVSSTFRNNFLQPATNVLLRVRLITQGEKRETWTKTCKKTMLRDKLSVSVSLISPP